MKLKSVLLSLFLFPGSGHIYLKRHVIGMVIITISLICLYVLVTNAYAIALPIADSITDKILSGDTLDITSISAQIEAKLAESKTGAVWIATIITTACWVLSAIDCYRIGAKMEKQGQSGTMVSI